MAQLEDLKRPGIVQTFKHVQLRYKDGKEYRQVFEPLIREEAEYDRKVKDSMKQTGLEVKWERSGRRTLAYFVFSKEESEIRVVQGDELLMKCLKGSKEIWQSSGSIIKTTNSKLNNKLQTNKSDSQSIVLLQPKLCKVLMSSSLLNLYGNPPLSIACSKDLKHSCIARNHSLEMCTTSYQDMILTRDCSNSKYPPQSRVLVCLS